MRLQRIDPTLVHSDRQVILHCPAVVDDKVAEDPWFIKVPGRE